MAIAQRKLMFKTLSTSKLCALSDSWQYDSRETTPVLKLKLGYTGAFPEKREVADERALIGKIGRTNLCLIVVPDFGL